MKVDENEFHSLVFGDTIKLEREISPGDKIGEKVNLEWYLEQQFKGEIAATILNIQPSNESHNPRVQIITVKPEPSKRKF